jgi:hypothetical protein
MSARPFVVTTATAEVAELGDAMGVPADISSGLALKADLASPTFTGTVSLPDTVMYKGVEMVGLRAEDTTTQLLNKGALNGMTQSWALDGVTALYQHSRSRYLLVPEDLLLFQDQCSDPAQDCFTGAIWNTNGNPKSDTVPQDSVWFTNPSIVLSNRVNANALLNGAWSMSPMAIGANDSWSFSCWVTSTVAGPKNILYLRDQTGQIRYRLNHMTNREWTMVDNGLVYRGPDTCFSTGTGNTHYVLVVDRALNQWCVYINGVKKVSPWAPAVVAGQTSITPRWEGGSGGYTGSQTSAVGVKRALSDAEALYLYERGDNLASQASPEEGLALTQGQRVQFKGNGVTTSTRITVTFDMKVDVYTETVRPFLFGDDWNGGFRFSTSGINARLVMGRGNGQIIVPSVPVGVWTSVVLDAQLLAGGVQFAVYYDGLLQTPISAVPCGVWTWPGVPMVLFGASDIRNSAAFKLKNVTWHHNANVQAALTMGGTTPLDEFERAFAYVPGLLQRSITSHSVAGIYTVVFFFDTPMPTSAYVVHVAGGTTGNTDDVVMVDAHATDSFRVTTRRGHDGASRNIQTTNHYFRITVAYQRQIVCNHACTVLNTVMTVLT